MTRAEFEVIMDATINAAPDQRAALSSCLELVARAVRDGFVMQLDVMWREGLPPIIAVGMLPARGDALAEGHPMFVREMPRG